MNSIVEAECARAGFDLPIPAERFATMIIALDGPGALYRLDPDAAPVNLLAETLTYLGEGCATRVT